ncbi:hypothetical protein EMGR_003309 [Emarellia grisea]
MAAYPITPEA